MHTGEREGEKGEESKGGIWRSADYAEQTQQLAEKAKTFTNRREEKRRKGRGGEDGGKGRGREEDKRQQVKKGGGGWRGWHLNGCRGVW